ncbi:MAG: hypothetical protein PHD07_07720 [Bacteroidales bacterium]|nr:hypothetical protein [Bacteroidales bacterium]
MEKNVAPALTGIVNADPQKPTLTGTCNAHLRPPALTSIVNADPQKPTLTGIVNADLCR